MHNARFSTGHNQNQALLRASLPASDLLNMRNDHSRLVAAGLAPGTDSGHENCLVSVMYYHWNCCSCLSMHQGFTRQTKILSGAAAGRAPRIWLYTSLYTFCVVPCWLATSH
eukprot:6177178-Pleurochrysis_carterae.AAC.1